MNDSTAAIIATALIVGVPSLISAVVSLSNRRNLRTGNGASAGEYLPIIAASVSTLGDEQQRVRDALVLSQVDAATALREATDAVKAEVSKAASEWSAALKAHTESDQRNFEELRTLISPTSTPKEQHGTQ